MEIVVDILYQEGLNGSPKMMTIGLHCRITGKAGRFAALKRFVEYIEGKPGVWVATVSFELVSALRWFLPFILGDTSTLAF
jgi:peptidoglycan/xylan/chitin deacetylase (PgdA/CDA1 family)